MCKTDIIPRSCNNNCADEYQEVNIINIAHFNFNYYKWCNF